MKQIGLKFNFREDWRALFANDTWFLYKRSWDRDEQCLARFNLWNVARWYFYQALISFLLAAMNPICRLADRYWRLQEGAEYRHITGVEQMKLKKPYWFVLGGSK